jgi:tetratricopeptide (TPR) repeat protein
MARPRPGLLLLLLLALAPGGPVGAQSLWDDRAFQLAREAHAALERSDWAAATRLAREAIAEYPDHVQAHYLLAQAALAQQHWDEAVSALQTVVRLYPKSFAGHRELGAALAQLDRAPEAARAFEAALALRPAAADLQDVQLRLALVRLKAGERDAALALLTALAQADTAIPEVWSALGRLHYEAERFADSERAFRRSAELRDDGRTWFNLAVVRLRLYDKPGAIEALERAARHPEVNAQAVAELGKLRSTEPPLLLSPAVPGSAPGSPRP